MELNATCASSLRNAGTTLPVMPARISLEAFEISSFASRCERPNVQGHIRPIRLHSRNDGAIPSPCCLPGIFEIWRTGGDREFRREILVNLDAQAGPLLRQHVTDLDFGTARKYFLRLLQEAAAFVDAEVVT